MTFENNKCTHKSRILIEYRDRSLLQVKKKVKVAEDVVSPFSFWDLGGWGAASKDTLTLQQWDETRGGCKAIHKAWPSQESLGLCSPTLTTQSLMKTPWKFTVIKRPFWKPRNEGENGKQPVPSSLLPTEHLRKALGISRNKLSL